LYVTRYYLFASGRKTFSIELRDSSSVSLLLNLLAGIAEVLMALVGS